MKYNVGANILYGEKSNLHRCLDITSRFTPLLERDYQNSNVIVRLIFTRLRIKYTYLNLSTSLNHKRDIRPAKSMTVITLAIQGPKVDEIITEILCVQRNVRNTFRNFYRNKKQIQSTSQLQINYFWNYCAVYRLNPVWVTWAHMAQPIVGTFLPWNSRVTDRRMCNVQPSQIRRNLNALLERIANGTAKGLKSRDSTAGKLAE